jgi:4-diphosphocytidyl-2-C-methyl-D-erythritol kinase
MLCFPNCKINLGLYVTRKRQDGYHDIETVFYPVQWNDVLEAVPSAQINLHLSGRAITGNHENNLVWKAYQMLLLNYPDKVRDLDIYLHKVIPMGAGLGGGSADGAFMLKLVNDCCGLNLSSKQLESYALQLGSDCPFFINNRPGFASGRGEQITDLAIDLSGYSLQLVCPEVHVSTGKAFQMIQPRVAPYDLRQLNTLPVEQWKEKIGNDFEAPVFEQYPVLADIKAQLYRQGAIYASMSGSGSALYGLFRKNRKAEIKADVAFEIFYIA